MIKSKNIMKPRLKQNNQGQTPRTTKVNKRKDTSLNLQTKPYLLKTSNLTKMIKLQAIKCYMVVKHLIILPQILKQQTIKIISLSISQQKKISQLVVLSNQEQLQNQNKQAQQIQTQARRKTCQPPTKRKPSNTQNKKIRKITLVQNSRTHKKKQNKRNHNKRNQNKSMSNLLKQRHLLFSQANPTNKKHNPLRL